MPRLDVVWGNFWERGQTWYHFWQDTLVAQDLGDTGTLSAVLQDMASIESGAVDIAGSLAVQLAGMDVGISGAVDISGSLIIQLDNMSGVLSGAVDIAGSVDELLDGCLIVSAGEVAVDGQVIGQLDDSILAATGTVDVSGALQIQLEDSSLISSGVVGDSPIEGVLDPVFEDMVLYAWGEVTTKAPTQKVLPEPPSSGYWQRRLRREQLIRVLMILIGLSEQEATVEADRRQLLETEQRTLIEEEEWLLLR